MKTFSFNVDNVEVSEISNSDFMRLKLYAISNGVNRNGSEFLLESFEEGIKTIPNKPILAYYNTELKDVEEHNSKMNIDENLELFEDFQYLEGERPVGIIPESAKIYTEEIDGKSWIVIENALIWTYYNKQLVDLLTSQKNKKVSVEVEILDAQDADGVMQFTSWSWLGITILGKYSNGEIVEEGIEGAHLEIAEFTKSDKYQKFVKQFNANYEKINNNRDILFTYGLSEQKETSAMTGKEKTVEEFLAKKEWGTGSSIKIDKSKDAVSDSSWGDVNKTELRNKVLKAKNYKTLVKSVYLLVESGWEDSPASHLKYPVMEIKGEKAVYNAGGLLSAQQYGEKYDKSIARRAKRIRQSLGLIEKEKSEKMNKFIEFAKDEGYSYIGSFKDKLCFAKEEEAEVEKDSLSLYTVEKSKTEEFDEDNFKAEDYWVENPMNLFAEDDKADDDESDDEDDSEDKEDTEKESLKKELEACQKELASCKDELESIRMKNLEKEAEAVMAEDDCMEDEEKEALRKDMADKKFACIEDFVREVAYRKYTKAAEARKAEKSKSATFGIHKNENTIKNGSISLDDI